MMNTVAVSQSPSAAGEAAERSREASRQGAAESQDGGFPELLSKLAGHRERVDRQAGSGAERRGGGDAGQVLDSWRREALGGVTAKQEGRSGELSDADTTALMQALGSAGALPGATGLAVVAAGSGVNGPGTASIAARAATGTESGAGQVPLPDQPDLADLARIPDPAVEPASVNTRTATATLTVLRRETHLAPAAIVPPANGEIPLASVTARGMNPPPANVSPGAMPSRNGEPQPPASDAMRQVAHAQPVLPQVAVSAASNAHLGTGWRQGSSPTVQIQSAPDALPETGGEDAAAVARSDSLVNVDLASSVSRQIADRATSEASALTAQPARPGPALVLKHESPVKVLHIQLQPADLGTVTIRMTVKDASLRLDLEVGRGETARMIHRDREALSAFLRAAGYLIDGVEVRLADQSGAGAQTGNNQANMQMQGGQSGSSHSEARSPGERSHEDRRNSQFGNGNPGDDETAGNVAGRGGIYI